MCICPGSFEASPSLLSGTNNRFDAVDVLNKQWKHIYLQCKVHGITVVSFGADGDTRAVKPWARRSANKNSWACIQTL